MQCGLRFARSTPIPLSSGAVSFAWMCRTALSFVLTIPDGKPLHAFPGIVLEHLIRFLKADIPIFTTTQGTGPNCPANFPPSIFPDFANLPYRYA
jgi:hypothetical protein